MRNAANTSSVAQPTGAETSCFPKNKNSRRLESALHDAPLFQKPPRVIRKNSIVKVIEDALWMTEDDQRNQSWLPDFPIGTALSRNRDSLSDRQVADFVLA